MKKLLFTLFALMLTIGVYAQSVSFTDVRYETSGNDRICIAKVKMDGISSGRAIVDIYFSPYGEGDGYIYTEAIICGSSYSYSYGGTYQTSTYLYNGGEVRLRISRTDSNKNASAAIYVRSVEGRSVFASISIN